MVADIGDAGGGGDPGIRDALRRAEPRRATGVYRCRRPRRFSLGTHLENAVSRSEDRPTAHLAGDDQSSLWPHFIPGTAFTFGHDHARSPTRPPPGGGDTAPKRRPKTHD